MLIGIAKINKEEVTVLTNKQINSKATD